MNNRYLSKFYFLISKYKKYFDAYKLAHSIPHKYIEMFCLFMYMFNLFKPYTPQFFFLTYKYDKNSIMNMLSITYRQL